MLNSNVKEQFDVLGNTHFLAKCVQKERKANFRGGAIAYKVNGKTQVYVETHK